MVSEATSVQALPVVDTYPEKVEPVRTGRTQDGAAPVRPGVLTLMPGAGRRWNDRPLPGVTAINACRDVAVNVSRIITPALAQLSVFCNDSTCARISPSPVSG